MKTLDVNVLRESISKVTRILSGRGINVTQRGSSAYVESNKQGEPLRVNLPYIPDTATVGLINAINGFLDHEVGHLMFSDFKVLAKSHKMGKAIAEITNFVEDTFVEKSMTTRFRGSATNLEHVGRFFLEKYTTPRVEGAIAAGDHKTVVGSLIVPAVRAWSGQKVFIDYMADKWELIPELVKNIDQELRDKIANVKSTQDSLNCAVLIHKAITPAEPKASGPDKEEKPKEKSEEDGGSTGESNEDKGEKGEDEEGSESTKPTEDNSDDESEDGDGKESEEEPKDEAGDESEEPESKPKTEESEGEDDEESEDEDSEESDKSDESDKPDDDDGKGSDKSDSGEESEDDDEESGIGSETDDDDGKESSKSDGSKFGKSEPDESEPEDEDKDLEENEFDEDDFDRPETIPREDLERMISESGGFDEGAGSAISIDSMNEHRSADYLVYSKDFDVIEPPHKEMKNFEDYHLEELDKTVRHVVGPLQKNLERLILADKKSRWQPGLKNGRINSSSLYKLQTGDSRVFRRREVTGKTKDVAVSVLIDLSGSMASNKRIFRAMEAGYAMGQVLSKVGVDFEILGFTTKSTSMPAADRKKFKEEEEKMGRRYSRSEVIYMPVFKSFSEQFKSEQKKRMAVTPHYLDMRNNIDGECVEYACERLLKQPNERKVLFVLSDGQPAASGDHSALSNHLKDTVKKFSKIGIDIFGIGIETDSVRAYYPNYAVLARVSELPTVLIEQLRRVILG